MLIMLTNDDGIDAHGLRSLYKGLRAAGHVVRVVAPLTEQSAVGHAVTIATPLRVRKIREDGFEGFGVYGTPADCVKLGLTTLLESKPDIVVSGINSGANVGVDILYSGTVSAATEAALMGLPALAVSMNDFAPEDLAEHGAYVADFLDKFDFSQVPQARVLNLNFPKLPLDQTKGLRLCPQTSATYDDWYEPRKDPRGRDYYWLSGKIPQEDVAAGTDYDLLNQGYITLTPLRFDFTDYETLERLSKNLLQPRN